jgi:hypothetical protein
VSDARVCKTRKRLDLIMTPKSLSRNQDALILMRLQTNAEGGYEEGREVPANFDAANSHHCVGIGGNNATGCGSVMKTFLTQDNTRTSAKRRDGGATALPNKIQHESGRLARL